MHLKKNNRGLQFDCLSAFYWSMLYTIFMNITAAAEIANNLPAIQLTNTITYPGSQTRRGVLSASLLACPWEQGSCCAACT